MILMDKELQESREKSALSGRVSQEKPQEADPENTVEVSKEDYDKEQEELEAQEEQEAEEE